MKLKMAGVPFAAMLVAGCGQGNLYPLPVEQAYALLRAAPVVPGGQGVFGRLETTVSGDGTSKIYWNATGGTFASATCEANITPEGADKSRISAFCGGASASDGAAGGMVESMHRKAIIEHIDATLRGRTYDPRLAQGSTAGSWPDDPRQADGSYATAVGGALKMERDMKRDIAEMEKSQAEMDAASETARVNQGVNFTPGQPMINPSSN
jgi:hypothetical protein